MKMEIELDPRIYDVIKAAAAEFKVTPESWVATVLSAAVSHIAVAVSEGEDGIARVLAEFEQSELAQKTVDRLQKKGEEE